MKSDMQKLKHEKPDGNYVFKINNLYIDDNLNNGNYFPGLKRN